MNPYHNSGIKLFGYGIWDKKVYSSVAGSVVSSYDKEDDKNQIKRILYQWKEIRCKLK